MGTLLLIQIWPIGMASQFYGSERASAYINTLHCGESRKMDIFHVYNLSNVRWPMMLATAISSFLLTAASASAAEITHQSLSSEIELIGIEGTITSDDVKTFREIAIRYPRAMILLNSEGGALMPAIEIGKIIKISSFVTLVPDDATCTSSCALIWAAGTKRMLAPTGRVGFHASYTTNKGRNEESGLGNALVGNYLTLLNFSQKAIMFATAASPDKVLWLSKANRALADIDFDEFDLSERSNTPKPTTVQAPPIQTLRTSPPIRYAPPALAQSSTESGWTWYGSNSSGSELYYDPSTIRRTGGIVTVWAMTDHSRNAKVSHRSSKEMWEYSCTNQTVRLRMYVDYDATGGVKESHSFGPYESRHKPLVPDSVGMALWEEVCTP